MDARTSSHKTKGISRRSFFGLAGAAAVAVSGAGLAGCAAGEPTSQTGQSAQGRSWEVVPEPIGDERIANSVETDVVIVGAGIAGTCAALAAAEAGLSVAVLQKTPDTFSFGSLTAVWNHPHQQEAGIVDRIDIESEISQWMVACENMPNRNFVNLWRDRSAADIQWIQKVFEDEDGIVAWDEGFDLAVWIDWVNGTKTIAEKAEHLGATFYFETPGVQLVREDGDGRVIAVIGENREGEYIRFQAGKGVILCAGDYGGDPEMMEKWLPASVSFQKSYPEGMNTGDMHKAALWIGAAMDDAPHCAEIHYDLVDGTLDQVFGAAIPWLRVNLDGKRFGNENVDYAFVPMQDPAQPECMHIDIFDDNYEQDWEHMGEGMYRSDPSPQTAAPVFIEYLDKEGFDHSGMSDYRAMVEAYVKLGLMFKADTLEELAEQVGIRDTASFVETVKRYNQLVEKGVDEDFGKPIEYMPAIKQPPFYGVPRSAYQLACLGGLRVNTSMEVLDEEDTAIPGLYAAGINSGGKWFSGMVQPMDHLTGMPSARCLITARIAVESIIERV